MSWAKIDDKLFAHPKFLGVSLAARGLWLTMLSYAASLERDGWFPGTSLGFVAPPEFVDPLAHELVHATLWLRVPDGYCIHDYLRYNKSRKQLIRERKKTAQRVQALRARNAVTTPVVTRLPARPGPARPVEERARSWRRVPPTEELTEERMQMGRRCGLLPTDIRRAWDTFMDHDFPTPKVRVDATWRNWLRKERPRRTAPTPAPYTRDPAPPIVRGLLANIGRPVAAQEDDP